MAKSNHSLYLSRIDNGHYSRDHGHIDICDLALFVESVEDIVAEVKSLCPYGNGKVSIIRIGLNHQA